MHKSTWFAFRPVQSLQMDYLKNKVRNGACNHYSLNQFAEIMTDDDTSSRVFCGIYRRYIVSTCSL